VLEAAVESVRADPDLGAAPEALLRQIRAIDPGTAVPSAQAAGLVAHLCERQARMRQSSTDAAGQMFAGLEDALLDREKVRELFGPETEVAIADIRGAMTSFWHSAVGPGRGFATRQQLEAWVLDQFKADFGRLLETQSPLHRQFFATIRDRVEHAARNAHARLLEENLRPGARLQCLEALHWRMQAAPAGTLILPDCLAVAAKDDGTFQSLVYVTNDELAMVLVPLARDRLLAGMRGGESVPSTGSLDETLAAYVGLLRRR
jgi:hypothetical protein